MTTILVINRGGAGPASPLGDEYAGASAGAEPVLAQRPGLEPLLERGACTIGWASGPPTRLVEDGDLVVGRLGQPGTHRAGSPAVASHLAF